MGLISRVSSRTYSMKLESCPMPIILWFSFVIVLLYKVINKAVFESKTLTINGGITAAFMGFITLGFRPIIGVQLLSFFYLGKFVTKFGKTKKKNLEFNYSEKRNAYQVLANGSIPTILTIFSLLNNNSTNLSCFTNCNIFYDKILLIGSLVSFSANLGDTFSSELGILSKDEPRMITNPFKKVPPGTNGGVTLWGFIAALLAGLALGTITWFFVCVKLQIINVMTLLKILQISTLGSLLGTTLDSILGTLEFSGYNDGKVVDWEFVKHAKKQDNQIKTINSINLLSGNQVNFLSSLITTIT